MNIQQPLIEAPASDNYRDVQTVGYLESYDALLNLDYAFVAYKETDKISGRLMTSDMEMIFDRTNAGDQVK